MAFLKRDISHRTPSKKPPNTAIASLFIFIAGFCFVPAQAVLQWPNCKDVVNTDFKEVPLATRAKDTVSEPMKMAFDLLATPSEDAKGKVDVYFTERLGKVRKFDSKTSQVLTLATIPLSINANESSDGVLGIALDPGFKSNHHVFIYYSFISKAEKTWRIARFTLNAEHTVLDLASEIVILKIPILGGSKHPGGAMQFDAYGDLWITTGNDYTEDDHYPLFSSANTNDLRGKVLRIHPTPQGTYTIPEGNLFKPGEAQTQPEIYIMGARNPYTLSLDPVRRWAVFGDIGPDSENMDGQPMNVGGPEKTEEYNLAKGPGNYGYPFFSGDFATKPGTDPSAPVLPADVNWSNATPGLKTLPPAVAPIYPYRKACAISGPIYRYDGDLKSSIKFPPHFHRKWLVTDFNGDANKITAFTLNDDGSKVIAEEKVIGIPLHAPLDMQMGPDGALYVSNYHGTRAIFAGPSTGIVRIEYLGACQPVSPKLETVGTVDAASAFRQKAYAGPLIKILQKPSLSISVAMEGEFTVRVSDLLGRPLTTRKAKGMEFISLNEVTDSGVYVLHLFTAEGTSMHKLVRD